MRSDKLISFDYAIKYLLKDKADYEIVEGFISALLVAQGYRPVKIKALLDSESNREDKILKWSIADVVVDDDQGNKYIVEIDRAYSQLFLHKACFNSSRLIVDSIDNGEDYSSIKKVFHISILYTPVSQLGHTLYHGKTIIREIPRDKPLHIHLADTSLQTFDAYDVFPEYFIIAVPVFDDVIHQEIDEWLYVLKHSEVKENFKSPYMKKVAKRLNVLTMSPAERKKYNEFLKDSLKKRDYIVSAEAKGRQEGREEGRQEGREEGRQEGKQEGREEGKQEGRQEGIIEGKIAIARLMLQEKEPVEKIARLTGLSKEEIYRITV